VHLQHGFFAICGQDRGFPELKAFLIGTGYAKFLYKFCKIIARDKHSSLLHRNINVEEKKILICLQKLNTF
jgi:hypothetical protein